jgi:alanyl-tRNA synthetase
MTRSPLSHVQVRRSFLDAMVRAGHTVVAPSPIIPADDPTLLFTNAGMNQFKDTLLGKEKRSYTRAASCQPCMRVGGKHNDLDAVGKDGRHLTWFEMLGNWSFGDYGKELSIELAWKLVVDEYGLDRTRLYASVYKDDDESASLWKKIANLPSSRIVRLGNVEQGDEENFWSMGPTGPCGPCTELYYDQGESFGHDVVGGPTDRFLEFWNLVFMESDRAEDGTLTRLPMRSVDTGMGLERICALLQGKTNVFHADCFAPIVQKVAELTGRDPRDREQATSMNVLADHMRALTFVLDEGGRFSNEGRGYVLRRILRRAVRHAKLLGQHAPFLHRLVDTVVDTTSFYPIAPDRRAALARTIEQEEQRFHETVDRGLKYFDKVCGELQGKTIPGDAAFFLHDTYGFPVDLTRILAEERSLGVDMAGFQQAMESQRERSRGGFYDEGGWQEAHAGEELGFAGHAAEVGEVVVLRWRAREGGTFDAILDRTPFYCEGGGEEADHGTIEGNGARALVLDVQKSNVGTVHTLRLEQGRMEDLASGEALKAKVDLVRRRRKEAHHTATHLLHAALRASFGDKVRQAGSLVASDRLRFDITFERGLTHEELRAIETQVNRWILEDFSVARTPDVPYQKALEQGAIAFFGEKYGEKVRVVAVPGVSVELCGGNHVASTAKIGLFQIRSESALAAGVRRIEAVCHLAAAMQARADLDALTCSAR